jgi:hypothetical protein
MSLGLPRPLDAPVMSCAGAAAGPLDDDRGIAAAGTGDAEFTWHHRLPQVLGTGDIPGGIELPLACAQRRIVGARRDTAVGGYRRLQEFRRYITARAPAQRLHIAPDPTRGPAASRRTPTQQPSPKASDPSTPPRAGPWNAPCPPTSTRKVGLRLSQSHRILKLMPEGQYPTLNSRLTSLFSPSGWTLYCYRRRASLLRAPWVSPRA